MKKYILSFSLLISIFSLSAMNQKFGPVKSEKTDKRAAFLAALADQTLKFEDNRNQNKSGLVFTSLQGEKVKIEYSNIPTFSKAAVTSLKEVTSKEKAKKLFSGINDSQAYSIWAAHIIFISHKDLDAADDSRFSNNILDKFKEWDREKIKKGFCAYRTVLLRSMEIAQPDNIKRFLEPSMMQPWNKPLHKLVLEKLESGELKRDSE